MGKILVADSGNDGRALANQGAANLFLDSGTKYATKLLKTRQGTKSPLRLQMTCSRYSKKLYLSDVVRSPNRLVRMAAGRERSRQNSGEHQIIRYNKIIVYSAATAQPRDQ